MGLVRLHGITGEAALRDGEERSGGWAFRRLDLADGSHLRLGHWPPSDGNARGTVLVVTGRAECLEKYAEVAADLTGRGFRVVALDWRGQGGSWRPLPNPQKGHMASFDPFLDDLDAALPGLLDGAPGPVIGLAHSMGAHILLRHVAERRHPFAALVACAPMLGINAGPTPEILAKHVAAEAVRRGHGEDYAFGQADWRPDAPPFKAPLLTSDMDRFNKFQAVFHADPSLAMGGVTWGWLDAAYRSMDALLRPGVLERVGIPVLVLSAGKDRIVRVDRQKQAAARLPQGVLKTYPEGRHELLMEADSIRDRVWADIDTFLDGVAPRAQ